MIKSKYGFSVGEKVLFTYPHNGETEVVEISSFDPEVSEGWGVKASVEYTDGFWSEIKYISKIQPFVGEQLLFDF